MGHIYLILQICHTFVSHFGLGWTVWAEQCGMGSVVFIFLSGLEKMALTQRFSWDKIDNGEIACFSDSMGKVETCFEWKKIIK